DARVGFLGNERDAPAVRLDWNQQDMRRLLRLALPLGIISMLGSLNSNMPRYFVEAYSGSSQLGIFSAIASLISAGSLVVSAFGQSVFLPVAKACAALDRARYRSLVFQVALLGVVLGGMAIMASALFGRW